MNNWPPNAHYAPHARDHTLPTRLACRCLGGLCGLEVFLCDLIGDPLANSIHQHGHQRSSNSIANNNRVIETELDPNSLLSYYRIQHAFLLVNGGACAIWIDI